MIVRRYLLAKLIFLKKLFIIFRCVPLLQMCLGIWVGALLGNNLFAVAITSLLFILGRRRWFLLGLGIIIGLYRLDMVYTSLPDPSSIAGKSEVVITSVPQVNGYNQTAIISGRGLSIKARFPIYPLLKQGDRLTVDLTGVEWVDDSSPSYATFLKSQGVFYQLAVTDYGLLPRIINLPLVFSGIRESVQDIYKSFLPPVHSSLLGGMVLGSRANFDAEFKQALQSAGLSHLVAVSGYNVMVIVSVLMKMAGKIPRKSVLIISAIALCCFWMIVGTDNLSATRAIWGTLIALLAMWSGRRANSWLIIAYVATAMLVVNPLVWQNVSWQLSLAAVLGVCIAGRSTVFIQKNWLLEALLINCAAALATAPVLMFNFGSISAIGVISTLIVSPLVNLIMALGVFGIGMAVISGLLAKITFAVSFVFLDLVVKIAEVFATVDITISSVYVLVGIYSLLFASLIWLDLAKFKKKYA